MHETRAAEALVAGGQTNREVLRCGGRTCRDHDRRGRFAAQPDGSPVQARLQSFILRVIDAKRWLHLGTSCLQMARGEISPRPLRRGEKR